MGVSLRHGLAPYVAPARLGAAWSPTSCIVVTGGAVRLTGSGLGCPTWPRCTDESFRPHGALDLHEAIEFGNRMLTFVLAAVAVATFVAAWQTGRRSAAAAGPRARARRARAGGDRRHHRAHRPQPVGGLAAPAAVDGDDLASPCCSCGASTSPTRRPGPAARLQAAGLGRSFAVGLGRALPRHRRHRRRPPRRRRRRPAQRPRPAAGQPAARRRGVPAPRAHRRAAAPVLAAARPAAPSRGRVLLGVELARARSGSSQYFTDLPGLVARLGARSLLGRARVDAPVGARRPADARRSWRSDGSPPAVDAAQWLSRAEQRVERDGDEQQRQVQVRPVEQPHRLDDAEVLGAAGPAPQRCASTRKTAPSTPAATG